jgi:hypothetical protein
MTRQAQLDALSPCGCSSPAATAAADDERANMVASAAAQDRATLDASAHGIGLGVNEDAAGCLVSPPSRAAVVVAG